MSRRWDFGLISSERSLETNVKSTDLHIVGRNIAFELFPRTYKGKIGAFSGKKNALSISRERTRIWLHTRHQDEAAEPHRDGLFAAKSIEVKDLNISKSKKSGS